MVRKLLMPPTMPCLLSAGLYEAFPVGALSSYAVLIPSKVGLKSQLLNLNNRAAFDHNRSYEKKKSKSRRVLTTMQPDGGLP